MSTSQPTSGKGRAIAARILTVVALLLFLVGAIAFYLERTVLDEDGFETIATELIRSDEIRTQVAATAVEQLYANVDVEQAIAERLPEAQKALAPVLAGITRQGAEEAANRLLERPRLQEAWVRVATGTQRQLVELLEDEGEFVSTTGGEVVLDLRPIIVDLGEEVAIIGRVAQQLPESTGSIAIVSSDQLETVQTGARILQALANWLWLVAIAVAVLAVWLARGRRRIELGSTRLAGRARRHVAPVAARPLWAYGAVAGLVVLVAALVPLFQRGFISVLVFLVLIVAGVEALRRVVLSETRTTT